MYTMIPFHGRMRRAGDSALDDRFFRSLFDMSDWIGSAGFRVDIRENDASYLLEAELPGFDKEDISLDVKDGILTISAQHKEEKEDKDEEGKYLCRERSTSSFTRSFDVSGIDTEKITAAYDKGVLTLTLPKQTEEVPASRSKTPKYKHFGKVAAWWIHRLPWHAHRSGNVRLTLSEAGDGFRPLFHISI